MLNINDALSLISSINGNIWTLRTLSLTVNVAVLGWLMQRHGLYEIKEKILSTIGYTAFVIVIIFGMKCNYSAAPAKIAGNCPENKPDSASVADTPCLRQDEM